MTNPSSPRERNLLKGAIMRVFSRSELRNKVLDNAVVKHQDPKRPRVTKWAKCAVCNNLQPKYLMAVDHIIPKIPVDCALELMTWDQVVDRTWCDIRNLQAICETCHKAKSKIENQERKKNKKLRSLK